MTSRDDERIPEEQWQRAQERAAQSLDGAWGAEGPQSVEDLLALVQPVRSAPRSTDEVLARINEALEYSPDAARWTPALLDEPDEPVLPPTHGVSLLPGSVVTMDARPEGPDQFHIRYAIELWYAVRPRAPRDAIQIANIY